VELGERFEEALGYAFQAHRTQRRKGADTPYVAHLLAVASLVIENGGDEDESIAALLHDAVEDAGGPARLQDIKERFGDRVADLVAACSDTDVTPKPPYRERKEAHLAEMRECNGSVRLITLADKLHNIRSMLSDYERVGEALWSRFKGGREGTLWYYEEMVKALERGDGHPLHRELSECVATLGRLAGSATENGKL